MIESDVPTIQALGMRCPRPIVELAKARRRSASNAVVQIIADDLAFECDLRAWCETTRSELLELSQEGRVTLARVRFRSVS